MAVAHSWWYTKVRLGVRNGEGEGGRQGVAVSGMSVGSGTLAELPLPAHDMALEGVFTFCLGHTIAIAPA